MFSILRITCIATTLFAVTALSYSYAEQIRYQATSEAGLSYELVIESAAPEVMKPLPVTISVFSPNGTPITGTQINCSLSMPAMAMPSNNPPIKESEHSGQYQGVFLLTMGGLWQVELSSTHVTGQQETVIIPIPGVVAQGGENNIDSKLEDLFQEGKETNN